MTEYRITIPVSTGYQKPPRHTAIFIHTDAPVEMTPYDLDSGEPTMLRFGDTTIEFEADEVELQKEV